MVKCSRVSVVLAVLVLSYPLPAVALEYRLRVANLHEDAFYALLGAAGTRREGPVQGQSSLIEALDTGKAPAGILLYDRPLEAARDAVAKAFQAVRARAKAQPNGEAKHRWSEVRWEGTPGEQSVWVIAASRTRHTEVRDVALKGTGPLVRAIPHLLSPVHRPTMALGVPLGTVQGQEGDPALWNRHLSKVLDLSDGIAVVVGVNSSSGFADHVFIVVKHAPSPATYHVVLAWKERPHEIQAPGDDLRKR